MNPWWTVDPTGATAMADSTLLARLGRRWRRTIALVGISAQRLLGRLRCGDRVTVALSVLGVALAIGFMVVVTGISVGLTTQTTVYGSGVDYWVVPESSSSSTMAVAVGGPEFGAVHPTTDRIRDIEGVTYASAVKAELVRLNAPAANTSRYVLLLGVIPEPGHRIGGLPTDELAAGDPHFGGGDYDGPWTGDIVLSDAAATLLETKEGATLTPTSGASTGAGSDGDGGRTFHVRNVSQAGLSSGAGPIPVALVHLAELQTLTGGADQDAADRFLVQTNSPGVADRLAGIYPQSRVVAQSGVGAGDVTSSKLALAIALTAFVVALCVGALFVTTALGLELTAERPQYATLTAIGVSTRSQSLIVVTQALIVTIIGGVIGSLAGYGGIIATNELASQYTGTAIATPAASIVLYALAVAVGIGLVASPYLVWLTNRADPLTVLD